jgi:hypothetical protein
MQCTGHTITNFVAASFFFLFRFLALQSSTCCHAQVPSEEMFTARARYPVVDAVYPHLRDMTNSEYVWMYVGQCDGAVV